MGKMSTFFDCQVMFMQFNDMSAFQTVSICIIFVSYVPAVLKVSCGTSHEFHWGDLQCRNEKPFKHHMIDVFSCMNAVNVVSVSSS